jgi:hypothetical protein
MVYFLRTHLNFFVRQRFLIIASQLKEHIDYTNKFINLIDSII